jgi:magnesium chelatase subunit D
MLDPQVAAALDRPPGRATPLAHGLTLAAAILRHETQQGGFLVSEAILVVVTDGRANVPLAISQTAAGPSAPVGQSGIRDALHVARTIRLLHRVRSVVIDPGILPDGHLTAMLAEALNAQLEHGSPLPVELAAGVMA